MEIVHSVVLEDGAGLCHPGKDRHDLAAWLKARGLEHKRGLAHGGKQPALDATAASAQRGDGHAGRTEMTRKSVGSLGL